MSFSVRPFNSKETLLLSDKRPVFSYVVCTKQRCLHQNFCVYYTEHYLTKNISLCQFLRYYKFSSDSYFRVVMIQIFIFWNIALHGGIPGFFPFITHYQKSRYWRNSNSRLREQESCTLPLDNLTHLLRAPVFHYFKIARIFLILMFP